ncbi:TlpA family protein disulfide reductase [Alkalimarinus coralli]|uniref:TlpA family protein disulfide reductase n=1 Tax=Alkalimarinus coralli TaxID=2935863 RepID=UPI00202B1270|nr:TlpA disulfide reductase family protein [Alkalimarinus coralli]
MVGSVRMVMLIISVMISGCGQVEFTLSNGEQKPLNEFKNNWLVINYWASWCKPCIEEIPQLNLLNKKADIAVLGVNFDGLLGEELAREAEALGINYGMIINDPSKSIKIERPAVLPATVLIDRSGKTREVLFGPQTVDSISEKLNSLDDES